VLRIHFLGIIIYNGLKKSRFLRGETGDSIS
jgi:hypothetical protein